MGRPIAALMVATFAAVACSSGTTGQPQAHSTLVWGKELDASTSNIAKTDDKQTYEIAALVYESLTAPSADGGVAPELATSWEQTSPTAWTFHLRSGVRFSNGRAFEGNDVAATWNAITAAAVETGVFAPLKSISVVDPMTVRAELSTPDANFPAVMEWMFVGPGKELQGGTFNPEKDYLGTGAFMVKSHVPDVSWTFVANPYYWRKGYPKVSQLSIQIIKDESARLAALKNGTIDFAIFQSVDTGKLLAGTPNAKVVVQNTTDLYYLALNNVWPQSRVIDQRVRQAINLAIDRQALINTALGGVGSPTGIAPAAFGDGCKTSTISSSNPDLAQAQALMKQAGISNLSINMTVVPTFGAVLAPQMAQVIQQQLQQIGIKVNLSTLDGGAWVDQTFTKGTFDTTLNWWTGGPDALHIPSYMEPASAQFDKQFVADDPKIDSLMTQALGLAPGPARTAVIQQVCQQNAMNSNVIALATKPTIIAYRTDLVNPVLQNVEPVQKTFREMYQFS